MNDEEKLIKEKIEDLKEYLEYGMNYSEYLNVVNAFEYIENKLKKQQKIINDMANEIYITAVKEDGTHFSTEQEVIDYFTKKYEEGKG